MLNYWTMLRRAMSPESAMEIVDHILAIKRAMDSQGMVISEHDIRTETAFFLLSKWGGFYTVMLRNPIFVEWKEEIVMEIARSLKLVIV